MEELKLFLELNSIDSDGIMNALHMDIREIILKAICEKLKNDKDFFIKTKRLYFSMDDILLSRTLNESPIFTLNEAA